MSNVILAHTGSNAYTLRIYPSANFGNEQMTLRLGTTNGAVLVKPGGTVRIDTDVADAAGVAGGMTVLGGGNLTMARVNTYTGTTTVVGSSVLFQTVGPGQATAIDNRGWVTFSNVDNYTQSGNLSGSGSFGLLSFQPLVLSGANNTHTGTVSVVNGGVQFGSAGSLGGASARYLFRDNVAISAGAALTQGLLDRIDPASRGAVRLTADSSAALTFPAALADRISLGASNAVTVTYSGALRTAGPNFRLGGGSGTLNVASVLADDAGTPRGVQATGAGPGSPSTVFLTGANTYTGPTLIDGHAILQLAAINNGGETGPLGTSSADAGNLVLRGGTLAYVGGSGTTTRGFTLAAGGTVGVNNASANFTFSGDLSRAAAGTLNVLGPGVLALNTVNGVAAGSSLVGGVWPWATFNGTAFATAVGRTVAAAAPDYVVSATQTLAGAPATANVLIDAAQTNQTVSANRTINSLITDKQVTVTAGATLTLASGGLIVRGANGNVLNGAGTLTAGRPTDTSANLYVHTPSTGSSAEMTLEARVADRGSAPVGLVKAGPGILDVRGANTYTGGTAVNGGILYLDDPLAGGPLGTLGTGPVTVNEGSGPASTFAPNGVTTGLLARFGGTVPNAITVGPGEGGVAAVGTAGNVSGAQVTFGGDLTLNRTTVLQGGIGETTGGTFFTGTITGPGDVVVTNPLNGSTGWNKVVFAPSGTNAFGNLFLDRAAVLQLGNNSASANRAIPDASTVYFAPGAGLWVLSDTSGGSPDGETVNALVSLSYGAGEIRGRTPLGSGTRYTLTVGAGGGSGEFSGTIFETVGTSAALPIAITKVGAGTQTLSGSNTYKGGTRVEGGKLLVNNVTGSGTGSGAVVVAAGGTLGGNGTIVPTGGATPNRVVIQNAGTLTAGTQAGLGQTDLTIGGTGSAAANGLLMEAGSAYRVRLFGTGADDVSRVVVLGDAEINTNLLVLDLTGADVAGLKAAVGLGNTRAYTVMTAGRLFSAADAPTPGFDLPGFSVEYDPGFLPGEWRFGAFDTATGTVTILFAPVPEPGSALAVAAAVVGLVGFARGRGGRSGRAG